MITDEQMYEEVYEILKYSRDMNLLKIPKELIDFLNNNRDKNYKTRIDKSDLANCNNIDQRTIDLIAWINYTYLIDDKEEKEKLLKKLEENDNKKFIKKLNVNMFDNNSNNN